RRPPRAEDSSVSVLIFEAVLTDLFVSVGNWRRDHVRTTGPFAEIDQAAALATKREVGIVGFCRLLADRATELDGALARHIKHCRGYQAVKNPASYQGIALAMPQT